MARLLLQPHLLRVLLALEPRELGLGGHQLGLHRGAALLRAPERRLALRELVLRAAGLLGQLPHLQLGGFYRRRQPLPELLELLARRPQQR